MTVPHEPWLVALSVAIAIQGSFVGLSLARELERRGLSSPAGARGLLVDPGDRRLVDAFRRHAWRRIFPAPIDYLVLPTLVSFLICVIVVGIGVYAAHAPGPPLVRIGGGARRDGTRHQPHALCRHVGGASGRTDATRSRPTSPPPFGGLDRARARSRCGRSTAARRARACSRRARPRASRFPACITRRWRGCGSTRNVSTSRVSSAPNSALSRNTLALLATRGRFWRFRRLPAFPRAGRRARDSRSSRAVAVAVRASTPTQPRSRSSRIAASHAAAPANRRAQPSASKRTARWRDIAARRNLRRPRQRALHLYPRRRAGIFLQSVDQRRRGAARSERVLARAPQPHRLASSRRAREAAGESGVAELGEPVRCSIPIARAHYREVKKLARGDSRARRQAAIHEMRQSR